ncbi:MAG: O-antigen ligase family protein, partial [Burkholderiales bacterium]|nr:O-antigen ligase family protein [Burkholderiales bacterium]
ALALGLLSAVLAATPRWALLEWGLLVLLILTAFGVAAQRRQLGSLLDQPLVLWIFATAAAYATSSCVVYITMLLAGPHYGLGFNTRELYPNFSNLRFFGHIQTMLIPFLLLPAMWWGITRVRCIALCIVPAIWWMLVVGSGTRGTWIALLIGVIAVSIYGKSIGRRWIKWQFAGLLIGLVLYVLFVVLVPRWLEQHVWFLHRGGEIMTLSLRDVLWRDAVDRALQHPLLGMGPMHYAYSATAVGAHPHNAVLQWMAEWGMPATLLLIGVFAAAGLSYATFVGRRVEVADSRSAQFQVALLAALSGASAQAMVDGVLVMPVSQTLLALLCGWAMGLYLPENPRPMGIRLRASVMALAMFAAVMVASGIAPEVGRLAERERSYLAAKAPDTVLLPRFWTQGLIGP